MDKLRYLKPPIPIKLADPKCMPIRAHETDAGVDMYSVTDECILPNEMRTVDTGIAVKIPVGYVGIVCSKSGQGKLRIFLANSIGVIDSDYRGNIKVMIVNEGDDPYMISQLKTKVAQLIVMPIILPEFVEYGEDDWLDTKRGEGGFGSTG